jgi:hypothetical protein
MPDIDKTLTELGAAHALALEASTYTDRVSALQQAQLAVNAACDREQVELQRATTALQSSREHHMQLMAARAECTRLECAQGLLAEVWATGPESIAALMRAFCAEPTRTVVTKIRSAWDGFTARALIELGAPLADSVFGQLLLDAIAAQPGLGAAVNALSTPQFGSDAALFAIHAAVTAQTTPGTQSALGQAEQLMLTSAKHYLTAHPNAVPEQEHLERCEIRRACATHSDLCEARARLDAELGARAQAEFARTYSPPESDGAWRSVLRGLGITPAA